MLVAMPNQSSPRPASRRRPRRCDTLVAGDREALALAAHLGGDIRRGRRRRHLTQAALGARVGVRQPRISELERGEGADAPLRLWVRIGIALGTPLSVALSRRIGDELDPGITRRGISRVLDAGHPSDAGHPRDAGHPSDAGHLAAQELVLRLARATGRAGLFELPTRPANPARSVDVGIRDDTRRLLILVEIWNRLVDVGAAARATGLKAAQARELAVAIGGDEGAYDVASVWLLVPTAANRALVRHYPEVFRSRFPGSSALWVEVLSRGGIPPTHAGLAWADAASGRLVPIRLMCPHRPVSRRLIALPAKVPPGGGALPG
jgi:transcriptional regulator with XRE-family HTH domain